MNPPPLIFRSRRPNISCNIDIDGSRLVPADDELSDSSTSSSSELPSPDRGSSEEEVEEHGYNEDEFLGILALARDARGLYERSGNINDLEDCIAYLRDALTVGPRDNRDNKIRADVTHKLAYDLYIYHVDSDGKESPDNEDPLSESIALHRQALRLLPARHRSRALYITRLAIALRARFAECGCQDDLRECISLHRKALSLCPQGHSDRSQSLSRLANAYWTRFELCGTPDDLQCAIRLDTEALELRLVGHPNRTPALVALAMDLSASYMKTNRLDDLTRAIELEREAIHLNPTDSHIARAFVSLLVMRYQATQDPADFDLVTTICSSHVGSQEEDDDDGGTSEAAAFLCMLAEINTARYEHVGNSTYLIHAVQLSRQVLDMGHCDTVIFSVARAFFARYRKQGNPSDFDGAVDLCRQALVLCPPGHPHRALCLFTIAQAFEIYFDIHRQFADLDSALKHYAEAVEDTHGSIRDRLRYAQAWVRLADAFDRNHSLSNACTASVLIFARIVYFDQHLDIRMGAHRWGSELQNAILATVGLAPATAFEALEYVRSLLWLLSLNPHRTPKLDGLSPSLLQKLCRLSWQLEQGAASSPSDIRSLRPLLSRDVGRTNSQPTAADRRRLTQDFDALVSDARRCFGDSGFLRPLQYTRLSNGWGEKGFAAMLMSTSQECHALVIFPTSIKPLDILLPLSPGELINLVDGFAMAAHGGGDETYRTLLGNVWEQVVKPITQKLILRPASGFARPRVWWCPVGRFAGVPVHAAGIYARDSSTVGTSTYMVSSYIPTISSLQGAPWLAESAADGGKVLQVVQPTLPESARSPGTTRVRIDNVSKLVPPGALLYFGSLHSLADAGDEPIDEPVLETTAYRWMTLRLPLLVGQQNSGGPSGIQLEPGSTVSTITVCLTPYDSVTSGQLYPEYATLATTFFAAGFKSIIGTMWPPRSKGSQFENRLRRDISQSGLPDYARVPYVIENITQQMRESGEPFSEWASYLHFGL